MQFVTKTALASALVAALFAPALAPMADAENVQGQATIVSAQTCGLNFVSGSPIAYGSLSSGQLSTEQTLVIDNTGTGTGSLVISGGNWVSGATTIMNVGATHYASVPGLSYTDPAKLPLSTTPASFGTITPTTNKNVYFQLRADLVAGQTGFTGSTTQTVTFTSTC